MGSTAIQAVRAVLQRQFRRTDIRWLSPVATTAGAPSGRAARNISKAQKSSAPRNDAAIASTEFTCERAAQSRAFDARGRERDAIHEPVPGVVKRQVRQGSETQKAIVKKKKKRKKPGSGY